MKAPLFMIPLASSLALSACNSTNDSDQATSDSLATNMANENDWKYLFNGTDLTGWHGFNKTGKVENWVIEDSALVCLGASADAHGGDIVTDETFGNFELEWEWKVDKGSNSGLMYHVVEGEKYKAPYETGPEYQIIDDLGYPGKLEEHQKAGANYAMKVPNELKKLNAVGEWNNSRILYSNGHVEHWLNGEKILEFETDSEEWKNARTTGKWKDYPDYAATAVGSIALQDHGNKAYFKNIRIKPI